MAKKKSKSISQRVREVITKPVETKKEVCDLSNDKAVLAEAEKIILEGIRGGIGKFLHSKQAINADTVSKLAIMVDALNK